MTIGERIPRVDARDKVTGATRYTSDLRLPGMLHAAVARSPFSRARIGRIDVEALRRQPGVVAVVTGRDVPRRLYGPFIEDQPVLAFHETRYQGEPVAAVVAESRDIAVQAAEDLDIDWEPLEAAASLIEALRPDALRVQPDRVRVEASWLRQWQWSDRNVCHAFARERGDVEEGLRTAEHLFEDVFTVPAVHHFGLEPFTALAQVTDDVEVWSATQSPFVVRRDLARTFGLPLAAVRVIAGYLGGGFGGKLYTKIEPIVLASAMAARGRPVRLELAATEWPLTVTRHGGWIWLRTGVDRQGRMVARDCAVVLDTGAYADAGPTVAEKAGFRAPGPYRIPNVRSRSCAVYTNLPPAGAYRGFGAPQVTWASESQIDIIADSLGIDPVEFRRKNLLRRGDLFSPDDTPLDCDLMEALERVSQVMARGQRTAQATRTVSESSPALGTGFACGLKDGGGQVSSSNAEVRLERDGSVSLLVGAAEMGQGTATALTQIVAAEMQVPLSRVRVVLADTGRVPYDSGTSSSRTVALVGKAVVEAARAVLRQLVEEFREQHRIAPSEDVGIRNGAIVGGGIQERVEDALRARAQFRGDQVMGLGAFRTEPASTILGARTAFWEPGIAAAQVEVDPDTGAVAVRRFVSSLDAGRAINPALCEGQHLGAAMMGLGHALFEALEFEDGRLQNASLIDYRLPGFLDIPPTLESVLIENGDGPGPYGSKGVGESGILPAAPAIANAVAAAVGVRFRDLPLTPEAVWRALSQNEAGRRQDAVSGSRSTTGRDGDAVQEVS